MDAMIGFFRDGGNFMYVILVVFIAGLAIIVERLLYIMVKNRIDTPAFVTRVLELIRRGNVRQALELCRRSNAALPRILRGGLEEAAAGHEPGEVQQGFELASMIEIPKLEKRVQFLGAIANVATLMGLLGTIFGLISSFAAVANAPAAQKAILLTAGISTAMNTTAFGIIVAIPCMLAHSYMQERIKEITDEINVNVVRVYNRLVTKRG